MMGRGRSPETETSVPPPAEAKPVPAPGTAIEFPEPQLGSEPGAPNAPPAAARPKAEKPPAGSEAPPAASAARFRVQFSSIPASTLSVDGREIGPSIPAKTVELAEGTHRVRFAAEGLPPHERSFQVGAKESKTIAYQFPVGFLVINADPSWAGASVIIDGKYRGSLPQATRLRLPKGSYNVTLHREGFQPVTQQITIPERGEAPWTPPAPVAVDQGMGQ
jgi:hypothetical protein